MNESVGIAVGMLLTALHRIGLVALTHTPSPMGFLAEAPETTRQRTGLSQHPHWVSRGGVDRSGFDPEVPRKEVLVEYPLNRLFTAKTFKSFKHLRVVLEACR